MHLKINNLIKNLYTRCACDKEEIIYIYIIYYVYIFTSLYLVDNIDGIEQMPSKWTLGDNGVLTCKHKIMSQWFFNDGPVWKYGSVVQNKLKITNITYDNEGKYACAQIIGFIQYRWNISVNIYGMCPDHRYNYYYYISIS